ncbi:MAG TPA: bifunctional ADP-dependent NAD(P)H-hydrate dehydratase/NAD(P)H-hydrate epimerase, partial [Alphaproteobacteria bacterium]|nr:bifunctional ADP-dependent NAD(P)H-hydrate dehydratase/NAD(P)H-hydrate epimerase [Alphaproteobacteria bacterium]
MYRADFLASKNGISSYQLMRNAGKRIAREIIKKHQKGRVLILCGRGNNGG